MDFNIGGFNESLKYSYQQFCKQDLEGREHNHRILMKLKKFEAKSFDLMNQTQAAQQMKNQYEKMLMQQNPLLWAQLQRSVRLDTDFEVELPLERPHSGFKHTKEVAINTSNESLSSEQHSLQEEGIWPHTPSPSPDVLPQTIELKSIQKVKPHVSKANSSNVLYTENNLNSPKKEEITSTKNSFQVAKKQELTHFYPVLKAQQSQPSVPESDKNFQLTVTPKAPSQLDFFPVTSSTPLLTNNRHIGESKNLQSVEEVINIPAIPQRELSSEVKEAASNPSVVTQEQPVVLMRSTADLQTSNESTAVLTSSFNNDNKIDDSQGRKESKLVVATTDEPVDEKEVKPFCLDSEPESADNPSISGPPSGKNVGDDDSDSFWN